MLTASEQIAQAWEHLRANRLIDVEECCRRALQAKSDTSADHSAAWFLLGVTLGAVPSARLLIFRNALQGSADEHFRPQLIGRGIDPKRFQLSHAMEGEQGHLSVYEKIDVALDPFPWSGHTTTCEALWMGVPVVTWYGRRYASRVAACALEALGLSELIADTLDNYLAIAVDWATDLDRLTRLRLELRDRMLASPLCDGRTFTLSLEKTYRDLWRRACATQ
jgi:predicted O-linked N-acetylglucosamine transferase (SPINDLY family)